MRIIGNTSCFARTGIAHGFNIIHEKRPVHAAVSNQILSQVPTPLHSFEATLQCWQCGSDASHEGTRSAPAFEQGRCAHLEQELCGIIRVAGAGIHSYSTKSVARNSCSI